MFETPQFVEEKTEGREFSEVYVICRQYVRRK